MRRLSLILLPIFLFASDTDIVPRTINFIIFVFIMYFLLANVVKSIYKNRITSITNKLVKIEDELDKAKKQKEEAIKRIEIANKEADELIVQAKVQAEKLSEKIIKDAENEILNLKKTYEQQKKYEIKNAKEKVVSDVLDEIISKNINLEQDSLIKLVSRKIS